VWDEHRLGTSGVTIEIAEGVNSGRKTTTDADGTYTLGVLAPGLLTVDFSKGGYQTSRYSTELKSKLTISRELQLPR